MQQTFFSPGERRNVLKPVAALSVETGLLCNSPIRCEDGGLKALKRCRLLGLRTGGDCLLPKPGL